MEIKPIAYIHNEFRDKFGIPRQSGRAAEIVSEIVFEPEFRNPDALRELDGFDYLWLIFDFSLSHREGFSPTVRPPRLGGNRRVGVFASRSPFRPNSLGLSSVRLVGTEKRTGKGTVVLVAGADLLDGTPIYDIKPYLPFSDSHPEARSGYAGEPASHRLETDDPDGRLESLPDDVRTAVLDCIADDPRPSYIDDPGRVYGMTYGSFNISFRISGGRAIITAAEPMNGR
ncbi:MAG: tRNA (N6-threonylcarbamoyladenosine(37)-N6)-methyltransferase TrmO [Clostridia bacterium]|nr:tRNA (N6-threonylcarbamoyladenosine(37)-N6)-methyltransferase TrmO [Clostridia bacterium]